MVITISRIHDYTVVSSQMATSSTLVLLLQAVGRPMLYKPGQYATISFLYNGRPTSARCFSITSSPTEENILQFGVRITGNYTAGAVEALKPGAKVIVEGAFGKFIFNPDRDRSVLMLGGGIGVTPFLSMLRYAAGLQLTNDIMLIYSCRTQDDVPFLQELAEMERLNPHLHVVFVIGSGPTDRLQGLNVVTGRTDGALLDRVTSQIYAQRRYFICGPLPFMRGMKAILRSRGVPLNEIVTEMFAQGDVGTRPLRYNFSLQVYALTSLSLVVGSIALLVRDALKPLTYVSSAAQLNQVAQSENQNSRQTQVDQTITNLQSGTTTPSGQSTDQTGNGATTVAPPTPEPSGNPGPSPGPSPSPTPAPTPTPGPSASPVAPVVSFGASSTTITSGDSTTLSWSMNSDATPPVACTASGGWSGTKSTSGSQSVSPSSTTTYLLTCSNSAGSASKSVKITVQSACVSSPSTC